MQGGTQQQILEAVERLIHSKGLAPVTTKELARDTELLARFRDLIGQINGGPQSVFERVAVYIEEEQQLGRIEKHVPALSIATLLLGPCFQRIFVRQLLGSDPFGKTDQQFAEELVQALIPGLLAW